MLACHGVASGQAAPRAKPGAPAPTAPPVENYTLRQAVIAWDMLSKVDVLCPDADGDRQSRRLQELEATAQRRLKLSAKTLLEKLAQEVPPVLMTPEQAVRVVANAGGCRTEALAQWRGRAAFVADTSRQVLSGEARADRVWPRDAALDQPVRIVVLGRQKHPHENAGIWLSLENRAAAPARFALLGPQLFVGYCTRLIVSGAPVEAGYAPRQWLTIPPHGSAAVLLAPDDSCTVPAQVNVGGAAIVDMGDGPRYWRFLVRGVGTMPGDARP
jgi:hypothetical protein